MLRHWLPSSNTPEHGHGDYANIKTEQTEIVFEAPTLRKAYTIAKRRYVAELRDAPLSERVRNADPDGYYQRPRKLRFSGVGFNAFLVELEPCSNDTSAAASGS